MESENIDNNCLKQILNNNMELAYDDLDEYNQKIDAMCGKLKNTMKNKIHKFKKKTIVRCDCGCVYSLSHREAHLNSSIHEEHMNDMSKKEFVCEFD